MRLWNWIDGWLDNLAADPINVHVFIWWLAVGFIANSFFLLSL